MDMKDLKEKVFETIRLARELNVARKVKDEKFDNSLDNSNITDYFDDNTTKEPRKVLVNYLNSLTDEEILAIQAVMYIGRDEDYNPAMQPEQILKAMMEDLGFDVRDHEIDQIVQKAPLPEYLINGLKILKLF